MKKKLYVFLGFAVCFVLGWLSAYISTQGLISEPPKSDMLISENAYLDIKVMYAGNSVLPENQSAISIDGVLYIPSDSLKSMGYDVSYNETSGVLSYVESDIEYEEQIPDPDLLPSESEPSYTPPAFDATTLLLSDGQYVVGEDIPAGKYDVSARSGSGNFMGEVASLGLLGLNEILSADPNGYGSLSYSNLRLQDGDVIEIRGDLQIRMDPK